MPKARRPENKGLPARWRLYHGAYYYCVPPGREHLWEGKKQYRLGRTVSEAHRTWATRVESAENIHSIGQLLDRYAIEVIPLKALKTQTSNRYEMTKLRAVFGEVSVGAIKPKDIYTYIDKRKTASRVGAHREIQLLSHVFTKAVQWGYIERHPFKGEVRREGEKARTRYIEDWEILECLALTVKREKGSIAMVQAYIALKLLTGLRQRDLLMLRMDDCKEDGIHVDPSKTFNKTGKRVIYEWSDALRAAVERVKDVRSVDISPYLFCTIRGKPYVNPVTGNAYGWGSLWQRFMKRVLAETKIEERFTEHDLRGKAGSDAKSIAHAQQLLSHADVRMTTRAYRRKPEVITPLK